MNDDEKKVIKMVKALAYQMFLSQPKTEHEKKIRGYFNLVRRVSYQLLDCLYVKLPIRIDYNEFVGQLSKFLMRKEEVETISEFIDHYTRIVYKQIYHSNKARTAVALWADAVFKNLAERGGALEIVKGWLKSSEFSDVAQNPCYDLQRVFSCILPNKLGINFLTESFQNSQVDRLEIEAKNMLGPTKKVLVLYIPGLKDPISEDSAASELLFEVYSDKINRASESWKTLALTLVWIHRHFKNSWGTGLIVKTAMESILHLLAPKSDLEVATTLAPNEFFKDEELNLIVPEDKVKTFRASQREEALQMFRQREVPTWDTALKEQFHECRFLRAVAKKIWKKPCTGLGQYVVLLPGRIKFCNQQGKQDICEFDGALLTITKKRKRISEMILVLLEAKSGRRNSKFTAKKNLQDSLAKLEIDRLSKVRRIKKDAYVEITLLPTS